MDAIDKTKAFMLIEAENQATGEVFALPANARLLVRRDQTQQPINAGPSDTTSIPTLQLTLDKMPRNEKVGYVFGSHSDDCDVLLDTGTHRGISGRTFSIGYSKDMQVFKLKVHTHVGFFVGLKSPTGELNMMKVKVNGHRTLHPGETWIVGVGMMRLALTPVVRDKSEWEEFSKTLHDDSTFRAASLEKMTPDIGRLNVQASAQETPVSRVLKGVWGEYTTAGWATHGTRARITGCHSNTGVTCCIKEANAADFKDFLKREIVHLRRVAHPSIIQYIDRDQDFAWMAMEFASLGTLESQEQKKPFALPEIEVVIYQALNALGHLHACNIVHHEINPENILVQIRDKRQILVKVAGFGLSATPPNNPGAQMGTASYLAPECFKQPPESWDAKVDVWALAMVVMRLLFGFPSIALGGGLYLAQSPYAEGWRGKLKIHFDQGVDRYKHEEGGIPAFFQTLARMFDMEPGARVGALEASQALRESYEPGYFFSIGKRNRTLPMIEPMPLVDTRRDDNSIFRFRELDIETLSGPLLMLEGVYLVNMNQLIEVINQGKSDVEHATFLMLKDYGNKCWRFKRTNELPERYIRLEDAMSVCANTPRLHSFVRALMVERAELQGLPAPSPGPEAIADDSSDSSSEEEEPWIHQIGLVESIPAPTHIIAITQEGRMLLVRARDGYIHLPSLRAVQANLLLPTEDVSKDRYIPLRDAISMPNVMSHDDIISLGAVVFNSWPSY